MGQKIESTDSFRVDITDERGIILSVTIDPARGPMGFSGRLLAERGSGERVVIEDTLRFLDEIWSRAYSEGLKAAAAK